MNTRLTVADVRTALGRDTFHASSFLEELNQVCDRFINSKQYKGNVIRVTIQPSSTSHFITLPVEYLSALGAVYNHWPTPIFGEFHTYFESGPGTPIETDGWMGQLQDMGDGYCSQEDIIQANTEVVPNVAAEPGSIVLYCGGSDTGKTVRIFGIEEETGLPVSDANGVPGELITLTSPSVTSTKHYSKLTDVIKQVTNGGVTAWVAPTGGGSQYQIAQWLPWETRPRYRRYYTGTTTRAIEILARRRYQILRNDTDWVIPGCVAALKFGIKAINYEDGGYSKEAQDNWQQAFSWANEEATASRGGAQPSNPPPTWGGWNETIPQVH